MTKSERIEFGELIIKVHLSPYQRYQLIESLPYLSPKKLKQTYHKLKKIYQEESSIMTDINKIKTEAKAGKYIH